MRKIIIPDEAIARHIAFYAEPLECAIEHAVKTAESSKKSVWCKIKKAHESGLLLSSKVDDLLKAIEGIGIIDDLKFSAEIQKIASYSQFCAGRHPVVNASKKRISWRRNEPVWSKNGYLRLLDVKVCPYCNAELIPILEDVQIDGAKKTLPLVDCDHFYPKDKYPYLALALANLIPACSVCNERIKRNRIPPYPNGIHPYADDFHDLAKINVMPLKVGAVAGSQNYKDCVWVRFSSRIRGESKVDEYEKFLALNTRYEKGYTSVLCGILSKRRQYESIEYRKYILSLLPRTEVAKAIKSDFGFDLSPEEINQIQFGKAKIDIMGEVVAGLMRESGQHR